MFVGDEFSQSRALDERCDIGRCAFDRYPVSTDDCKSDDDPLPCILLSDLGDEKPIARVHTPREFTQDGALVFERVTMAHAQHESADGDVQEA